jgi:hypothetical protein
VTTEVTRLSNDWERGYDAGYRAALSAHKIHSPGLERASRQDSTPSPKPKRKASPANKKYGAAFRKVSPRFKTKSGKWKKDGFKNAVRAAHKLAKR